MPPNTISVTRPGRFGNPFFLNHGVIYAHVIIENETEILYGVRVYGNGEVEDAIDLYKKWLDGEIITVGDGNLPVIPDIGILKGKNLACFCKEGSPCHADILLKLVNQ